MCSPSGNCPGNILFTNHIKFNRNEELSQICFHRTGRLGHGGHSFERAVPRRRQFPRRLFRRTPVIRFRFPPERSFPPKLSLDVSSEFSFGFPPEFIIRVASDPQQDPAQHAFYLLPASDAFNQPAERNAPPEQRYRDPPEHYAQP